jgi:adenine-specific DNA-methyltransferase
MQRTGPRFGYGKDRVFILAAPGKTGRDFISEDNGELVIRFEYRPATLTDWPEDAREGKTKAPTQKDLIVIAERRVLAIADLAMARWIAELGKPHVTTTGEKSDYTQLEAHLRRYTARNTFDYFVHKDLGTFLGRELDFYVKNEVIVARWRQSTTIRRITRRRQKSFIRTVIAIHRGVRSSSQ